MFGELTIQNSQKSSSDITRNGGSYQRDNRAQSQKISQLQKVVESKTKTTTFPKPTLGTIQLVRNTHVIQRVKSFAEYIDEDDGRHNQLRQAYLNDIAHEGTWGTELEGHMLSQAYGVTIVFWANHQGNYQEVYRYGSGSRVLHILNSPGHFEALKTPPTAGEKIDDSNIERNSGGGDCLYKAFFQAYTRSSGEPKKEEVLEIRTKIKELIRGDQTLDLNGLLTFYADEYEEWGQIIGAGTEVHDVLNKFYPTYLQQNREQGGGSVPQQTHKPDTSKKLGDRDMISRKFVSRADRMIDRIGRIVATKKSIHVAVALDGNVLVMSSNNDTGNVRAAIKSLAGFFKQTGDTLTDPIADKYERRVKDGVDGVRKVKLPNKKVIDRRDLDLKKMEALKSGTMEALDEKKDTKLLKIKAALAQGLYNDKSSEQDYKNQKPGIYLIPHYQGPGTVHGEINVTDAIKKRRVDGKGAEKDDVYVGGTLIDCFDCNRAHAASNEYLEQKKAGWKFYSGGTHGNSFPGWKVKGDQQKRMDKDTFETERFKGQSKTHKWWDHKRGGRFPYGYTRIINGDIVYDKNNDEVIDWQKYPKSWQEDTFHRSSASSKTKTHSFLDDDSDSDTEDYPKVIKERQERKEQAHEMKLGSSSKVQSGALPGTIQRIPDYVKSTWEILKKEPVEELYQMSEKEIEVLIDEVWALFGRTRHEQKEVAQDANNTRDWLLEYGKWLKPAGPILALTYEPPSKGDIDRGQKPQDEDKK